MYALSGYAKIGKRFYNIEEDDEKPKCARIGMHQIGQLASSDEGAFRILQIGGSLSGLAGFEELSARCGDGAQALSIPRILGATREAYQAVKAIHSPSKPSSLKIRCERPDQDQMRFRYSTSIARVADALSVYCTAASLVAQNVYQAVGKAAKIDALGNFFSMVSDGVDAEIEAKNWNRARVIKDSLVEENAPKELINRFLYTQRYAFIRLVKSVLAFSLGLFAAWAVLFNTALVSSNSVAVISIAVGVLACAGILYKQSMRHAPVEMFNYFVPSSKA